MTTVEKLGPRYEVEMARDGDRLVRITIRAGEGAELGHREVREATAQILDRLRGERRREQLPAHLMTDTVRAMVEAYREGHGRVTDDYLARLAIAYEELAPRGRGVSAALAAALDKPTQTVKTHIMRARHDGFLSDALEGREGGKAQPKAHAQISGNRAV
ncbi:hypothetical protein ACQI4L_26200 [Mycolicibacterium litorale]|uniref:hypothetical protein n=1 Tax=Mycolicibacterium litorale TaxID=758802 RepID=UPI003CEF3C37